MKVLIVEDEATIRVSIEYQIRACFGQVDIASFDRATGVVQSLKQEKQKPDVAILDLQLPSSEGMDANAGFEIARELKDEFGYVPIIILTIRTDREAIEFAEKHEAGIQYFITKPWLSSELTKALAECLDADGRGGQPGPIKVIGE